MDGSKKYKSRARNARSTSLRDSRSWCGALAMRHFPATRMTLKLPPTGLVPGSAALNWPFALIVPSFLPLTWKVTMFCRTAVVVGVGVSANSVTDEPGCQDLAAFGVRYLRTNTFCWPPFAAIVADVMRPPSGTTAQPPAMTVQTRAVSAAETRLIRRSPPGVPRRAGRAGAVIPAGPGRHRAAGLGGTPTPFPGNPTPAAC